MEDDGENVMENSAVLVESLPGCGEFAAYSMLRLNGQSVSLPDVRSRFRQNDANFDPSRVSIAAVRNVLASFGTKTDAVRYGASEINDLKTPLIMYFAPGRFPDLPKHTGHFMTVTAVTGNTLSVLDWSQPASAPDKTYPISFFDSAWDGDAVVCRRDETKLSTIAWLMFTVISAVIWMIRRRDLRHVEETLNTRPPVALLLVGILCLFCGCTNSKPDSTDASATLNFIQPVANLGRIDSKELIHTTFEFQVPEESPPVRIVEIKTSCGCTTADSGIINKVLGSGSTDSLKFTIRPGGTAAQSQVVTAEVVTLPASGRAMILAIRYRPASRIQVSVSELRIDSIPGLAQDREFTVTYHRAENEPPVSLNPEKCDWAGLEFRSHSYDQSEISDGGVKLVTDETRIKVRLPAAANTLRKDARIQLAFDRIVPVHLPVSIRVDSPVKILLDNLFVGKLKPNAEFHRMLPWKSWSPEFGISRIESPESIGTKIVNHRIEIQGTAPESSGRFTETIRVHCSPESLPVIEVIVSGIVEP